MRIPFILAVSFTFATVLAPGQRDQASAQYRVQETPALNGLGMLLFKDIELRLDGGIGNTAATSTVENTTSPDVQFPAIGKQWYGGIFIDKPIVSDFLEMAYDCELFGQRDWLPRNTFWRDLIFESIRLVAFYRAGDFRVAGAKRDAEFYVGGRLSLDLGRIFRHLPDFQR